MLHRCPSPWPVCPVLRRCAGLCRVCCGCFSSSLVLVVRFLRPLASCACWAPCVSGDGLSVDRRSSDVPRWVQLVEVVRLVAACASCSSSSGCGPFEPPPPPSLVCSHLPPAALQSPKPPPSPPSLLVSHLPAAAETQSDTHTHSHAAAMPGRVCPSTPAPEDTWVFRRSLPAAVSCGPIEPPRSCPSRLVSHLPEATYAQSDTHTHTHAAATPIRVCPSTAAPEDRWGFRRALPAAVCCRWSEPPPAPPALVVFHLSEATDKQSDTHTHTRTAAMPSRVSPSTPAPEDTWVFRRAITAAVSCGRFETPPWFCSSSPSDICIGPCEPPPLSAVGRTSAVGSGPLVLPAPAALLFSPPWIVTSGPCEPPPPLVFSHLPAAALASPDRQVAPAPEDTWASRRTLPAVVRCRQLILRS